MAAPLNRKIFTIPGLVILSAALALLYVGFVPPRREEITLPLKTQDTIPSLPGTGIIKLAFSPTVRAGESQTIELSLTNQGAEPANLDPEYTVIVEARLELPLADVRPENLISTTLGESGKTTFYWDVHPRQPGDLTGTVWLYLRLLPKSEDLEIRQPVYAHPVEIRSRLFWGMNGSTVRIAAVSWLLIGLALSLPILTLTGKNRPENRLPGGEKIYDDYHPKN